MPTDCQQQLQEEIEDDKSGDKPAMRRIFGNSAHIDCPGSIRQALSVAQHQDMGKEGKRKEGIQLSGKVLCSPWRMRSKDAPRQRALSIFEASRCLCLRCVSKGTTGASRANDRLV